MSKAIDDLFAQLHIHPVLMEIGGRECTPEIWNSIAQHSIYVGVGPESKLICDSGPFYRCHLVDEVITTGEASSDTLLYLTKDPEYSSLLEPKPANTSAFLDGPCHLKEEVSVRSSTMNALVNRLALAQVDWLQTNVNGCDLRVYESVEDRLRRRILVLDTVLDLVDLWAERGSPVAAYQKFEEDGFWLSRVSSHGFVRMRPESTRKIRNIDHDLDERVFANQLRTSPGWLFVRFFRTIESLSAGDFSKRDYVLLWTFALLDGQLGYAADLTFEYERIFGAGQSFQTMLTETLACLRALRRTKPLLSTAKKLLPSSIRRRLRPFLLGSTE